MVSLLNKPIKGCRYTSSADGSFIYLDLRSFYSLSGTDGQIVRLGLFNPVYKQLMSVFSSLYRFAWR